MDGFVLPGYDVEELLGFGGSGEVWRAREHSTGHVVALKRLRRPGSTERLAREAALLATVRHDHVVRLRAVVPSADDFVLVLDFAEGGSLASVLAARSRLSAGEVVTIGAPLAQALSEVHARGLVHGDVTPGNILFDGSGKPLLADLGVASLAGEEATPMGATAGYADPAVQSGVLRRPSPASDVHGLAAVCYAALAGVPPYSAGVAPYVTGVPPYSAGEVAVPASLAPLAPGAPAALVAVIEAGLHADPAARPDAATFARAMFAACSPVAIRLVRAPGPTAPEPTHEANPRPRVSAINADAGVGNSGTSKAGGGRHRWSPRRRMLARRAAAAAAAAALLGGAVGGGMAWASHDHHSPAGGAPTSDADAAGVASSRAFSTSPSSALDSPTVSMPSRSSATPSPLIPSAAGIATSDGPAGNKWSEVMGALDSARNRAFIDADPNALSEVYLADSAALASDRETLAKLIAAGQHARGLRLELVAVRMLSQSTNNVTLAVRDTLPAYDLIRADGGADHVPGRGERNWTVVLHEEPPGRWQIASIAPA